MSSHKNRPRIFLTDEQFLQFLVDVLELPIPVEGFFEGLIKVETALEREVLNVDAIRIYCSEFMKEVNMTTERGEFPKILIKKIRRQKTGKIEYELVFLGSEKERHVEALYAKHPSDWRSWGTIYLTPIQAKLFRDFLNRTLKADKRKQKLKQTSLVRE